MATASSSAVSDAHPRPPEIATAAEGCPAAADAAAAKDGGGGGGGGGGNKSKKRVRLFILDMSTRTSDRILEPQREREGRI
jgi:hypothetical protein